MTIGPAPKCFNLFKIYVFTFTFHYYYYTKKIPYVYPFRSVLLRKDDFGVMSGETQILSIGDISEEKCIKKPCREEKSFETPRYHLKQIKNLLNDFNFLVRQSVVETV